MRHLLEVTDLTAEELGKVLDYAAQDTWADCLDKKGMALFFEKPSSRTLHSMEMAVVSLGGHPITTLDAELGKRESIHDLMNTLAGYHFAVGARVFSHEVLKEMAAPNCLPIINMLSDRAHPLQALADILTIKQTFGSFDGVSVAFVGDCNNVASSLALAAGMVGADMRIAFPQGYGFAETDVGELKKHCPQLMLTNDPIEAVDGASVVYTDVWASMGQEGESGKRKKDFEKFAVAPELMAKADSSAIFMHCLPAHRGMEVMDEVIDGDQSRVWLQAENRMHSARGFLQWLKEVS